jgi:hypothetical protein
MGSKLGEPLILTGVFGFMALMALGAYGRFAPDIQKAIELVQKGNVTQFKGSFRDTPSTQVNDNSNTFKTFEQPNYGIQILYPSNWRIYVSNYPGEIFHTDDIVSFLAPVSADSEADRPSLIISYISTNNRSSYLNLNLYGYVTKATKGYDNIYTDFKVIESSINNILAGKPAYKLVFTNVKHDINYKSMEIGTIVGDKIYSVTFTAEEKEYSVHLPTIQKMISSLKITAFNNRLDNESSSST